MGRARGLEPDPAWAPREGGRRNPSIGAAESTLLRRVNARLGYVADYGLFRMRKLLPET